MGLRSTAALALTLALPGEALAYRCTRVGTDSGPSLVWASRSVPYRIDVAITELGLEADARAAFEAWSEPACTDIRFESEGSAVEPELGYEGDGMDHNDVILAVDWRYGAAALALTTTTFESSTGRIRDVDIELNALDFLVERVEPLACQTSTQTDQVPADLANTLTHEVGHLVGLAHPPSVLRFADSTMYASADVCDTDKRSLAPDDIEAVCAIYPAGMETQPCFAPDQPDVVVVAAGEDLGGCRGTGAGASGYLLLAGLLLLRRRRK